MQIRAVLHCHSTWSYDGHWALDRIARLWGRMGAEVVMMTEHDTGFDPDRFGAFREACAAASTKRCTLVPGIEYSSPENDFHILTWGLNRFLGEGRPTLEMLEDVSQECGAAVFAHPIRRDVWQRYDPAWTPHLAAIEIWNRKSDGITPGDRAIALWQETGLAAIAGPDFHKANQIWPLMNRIEIDPTLDARAGLTALETQLVAAIRAGAVMPLSFGRPVLGDDGQVAALRVQRSAEQLRRGLRDLRNLVWRK